MRSIRRKTDLVSRSFFAAAALLLGRGVVSCREPLVAPILPAHPDDPTPRRGGVAKFASFGDVRGLDPAAIGDVLGGAVANLVFAGLVEYDGAGKIVPDLTTRWELLDEGRLYRFHLREGVHFHDGEELTADDVKRSIERALHPTTPNPAASFYESISGFADYTTKKTPHLEGVEVEGRYVVSIRLERADATFLHVLAMPTLRPVCKTAGDRYKDNWHLCGAGPFQLPPNGWDRGTGVRLVRFDGYFRPGLPYLDGVTWTYNINVVTQRFKFEAGELDLLRDITQADLTRFQNDVRWKPSGEVNADDTVNGEAMNTRMAPFDNVEVRRAVANAIDREHYRMLKPGNLRAANQPVPPGVPGHDPAAAGQRYDYPAALEHMRRAGYPYDPKTGTGGYPKTITYYSYQQGLNEYTAQVLQQEVAKIGLRIEIRLLSFPAYLSTTHRKDRCAFSPQGWRQDYPDPASFFEPLFASAAINEDDSSNSAFYANPRVDELIDRGRHEIDPAKRKAIYDEATAIVNDDAPWAFTHYYHWYDVWQPYLRSYKVHPVWPWSVRESWMDRGGSGKPVASRGGLFDGALGRVLAWSSR